MIGLVARVLLILPSETYRAEDFIDAARSLGVDVVVASDRRPALAGVMGDRGLRVDLRRPEAAASQIVSLAGKVPLDGIVAADDPGVLAANLAASRLGLPHNSLEAVRTTRDKAAMRAALERAGVPQPAYRTVSTRDDVASVGAGLGWPCVLKPVSLSASRGVIRVDDGAAAEEAAKRIRTILGDDVDDGTDPLLVERFVPGPEVAVEALLRDGRLELLAIFDKPDPLEGPYFEETLYVTPSRLSRPRQDEIAQIVASATSGLGLTEGPVHAELRLGPFGPVVIEVAARAIGGLCSRALRFGMGVTLEELILRHALGMPVRHRGRPWRASGVMMVPVARRGLLRSVRGRGEAASVPGVAGVEITVAPGQELVPLPEGDRYLGFIFARGSTPEEVEGALRAAHARLEVELDPIAS
jgi:biotin carboxylase